MTFQERLQRLLHHGNLTIADLARWLDRPHPTVSGWVKFGKEPGSGPLDAAMVYAQVAALEKLLKKKRGLPIPRLSPQARIEHLLHLKKQRLRD